MKEQLLENPFVDINHPAITAGKETAFVFVGQGVQKVGMGRQLYEKYEAARKIYDAADRITEKFGYQVTDVSFNGPDEKLAYTRFAQPAIFTLNHAYFSVLKEQLGEKFVPPGFAAGYSLGEMNTLPAFGAVEFEPMLGFIIPRGEIAQRVCDQNPSGMMAVKLGETPDGIPTISQQKMFAEAIRHLIKLGLEIGYISSPFHFGIGGPESAILEAQKWLEEYRKTKGEDIQFVRLRVNGAFHTSLMNGAVEGLTRELSQIEIRPLEIPIIGNTTGRIIQHPDEIRQEVAAHLTNPIMWYKSIKNLQRRGVVNVVEFGNRPIISKMTKEGHPQLKLTIAAVVDKNGTTIAHLLTNNKAA